MRGVNEMSSIAPPHVTGMEGRERIETTLAGRSRSIGRRMAELMACLIVAAAMIWIASPLSPLPGHRALSVAFPILLPLCALILIAAMARAARR